MTEQRKEILEFFHRHKVKNAGAMSTEFLYKMMQKYINTGDFNHNENSHIKNAEK